MNELYHQQIHLFDKCEQEIKNREEAKEKERKKETPRDKEIKIVLEIVIYHGEENTTVSFGVHEKKKKEIEWIELIPGITQYSTQFFFDKNEIVIGNISFNHSFGDESKIYDAFGRSDQQRRVEYLGLELSLKQEELLALFINEFIRKIEKSHFIIGIEIENKYEKETKQKKEDEMMIMKALRLIGFGKNIRLNKKKMKMMQLNDDEFEQFDKVFEEQSKYLTYKRRMERARMIMEK